MAYSGECFETNEDVSSQRLFIVLLFGEFEGAYIHSFFSQEYRRVVPAVNEVAPFTFMDAVDEVLLLRYDRQNILATKVPLRGIKDSSYLFTTNIWCTYYTGLHFLINQQAARETFKGK